MDARKMKLGLLWRTIIYTDTLLNTNLIWRTLLMANIKGIIIIIIIIMSFTPVSSSHEDIGGVPSMQSCYSAGMKRCGICMEERSPLWVRRSKSEETLCRLLITMVEETFDISRSWVDHGRPVMNLKSGYVEGENSKWKVKQRKMICGPFLIGCQAQWEDSCWKI